MGHMGFVVAIATHNNTHTLFIFFYVFGYINVVHEREVWVKYESCFDILLEFM